VAKARRRVHKLQLVVRLKLFMGKLFVYKNYISIIARSLWLLLAATSQREHGEQLKRQKKKIKMFNFVRNFNYIQSTLPHNIKRTIRVCIFVALARQKRDCELWARLSI